MNMYFIFVEGYYDEEFVNMCFRSFKSQIIVKQYSKEKKERIDNFIKSIMCIPDSDYIFLADCDGTSIEKKRDALQQTYKNLDLKKVIFVCYEIESWYYAGLTSEFCQKNKIKYKSESTDSLTKEQFLKRLPNETLTTLLLIDMLKSFSFEQAINRNASFSYFKEKRDEVEMLFR